MSGPATVGWCPGALRPMASGDGLILRIKPRGGHLTLDQAAAVARLSQDFGNGHLDLTGRANLQIRGARPDTLEPLWAGLREAGLLDRDADAEAVRNIVASPLAGLDPECHDTRPFVVDLEAALMGGDAPAADQPAADGPHRMGPPATTDHADRSSVPGAPALPTKWSFVVDGGGRLPLADVPADMRFRFDREGGLRIGLGTIWTEALEAPLDLRRLLAATVALVAARPEPMRMAALLARLGHGTVCDALGLRPASAPALRVDPPGGGALAADLPGVVAIAPPFGDLPAACLDAIVTACRAAGGSGVRLTPWRILLLTGIADRTTMRTRLEDLDMILRADDPRLNLSTCVGAPACHRATTATRIDAAALAVRLGRDADGPVHLAGCAKGCARPVGAAWTLIGRDGRYDLFRGRDSATVVAGLSFNEASHWLSRAGRVRIS